MNPFTRFISERLKDRRLRTFIACWDRMERLVIRVYRAKEAAAEDEAEYTDLRRRLREEYPRWQAALAPHWRSALVGGKVTVTDPFAYLLAVQPAAGFVDNWHAMQHLPAAREALNQLVLSWVESG